MYILLRLLLMALKTENTKGCPVSFLPYQYFHERNKAIVVPIIALHLSVKEHSCKNGEKAIYSWMRFIMYKLA